MMCRLTICMLALIATGHAAWADRLGQAPDDDVSLWRVGAALALCVALAFAGAVLLRMRHGYVPALSFSPKARRLKMIETLRLGRVATLAIVECDGREFLVLNSDAHVEMVERLSAPGRNADP